MLKMQGVASINYMKRESDGNCQSLEEYFCGIKGDGNNSPTVFYGKGSRHRTNELSVKAQCASRATSVGEVVASFSEIRPL